MAKTTYIAFLRAVNVGKRKVPMAQLRSSLEAFGLERVRTYIASGNAFFDADTIPDIKALEAHLQQEFGFEIPVLLRSVDEIERIIEENRFGHIEVTPDIRLAVTFVSQPLSIEQMFQDEKIQVIGLIGNDVLTVIDMKGGDFPGYGAINDKKMKVTSTARFYPTLIKILAAAKQS